MTDDATPRVVLSDSAASGAISFQVRDGSEVLRFDADGSIWVRGNPVETDIEVVTAFKQWLTDTIRLAS